MNGDWEQIDPSTWSVIMKEGEVFWSVALEQRANTTLVQLYTTDNGEILLSIE